jgi:hypothetical protein
MKTPVDLSIFEGKLMNGLDFCKKVYDVVYNIRNGPNGDEAVALRDCPQLKDLVQKLIPLSKFVQERYGPNRRLKVRWLNGIGGYDAQVLSSGAFVGKRVWPRRQWVEITAIVHDHDPRFQPPPSKRELMFEFRGSSVNASTRKMGGLPKDGSAEAGLAQKILEQVQTNGALRHPRHTVLVIECFLSNSFFQDDWERTIALVRGCQKRPSFSEIFVCDSIQGYSATIYGRPRRFISTVSAENGN